MVIQNMDSEARPMGAMERITKVAEVKGAERRERILKRFDRLLGAPEAAGEAMKIVGEKATDFKDRTEKRLREIGDDLTERATKAKDKLVTRVTETKDKAVAKAKAVGEKAVALGMVGVVAGVEAGKWLEDRAVAVCTVPAELLETASGMYAGKAKATEDKLAKTIVDQAVLEAHLDDAQKAILEKIIAAQGAVTGVVERHHERVRDDLENKIDVARERSAELKATSRGIRRGVEDKRIFKRLLERLS